MGVFMEKRIVANNDNIKEIVEDEIKRLGNKADLNYIDVSNVTVMNSLFEYSKFNGDISKWDVSKVENMNSMFSYSKFNQDISNWDVGNVMDMSYMFPGSPFNQDISKWNVGNVEDMYWMFENSPFKQDINMWNYNFKAVEEYPRYFILATTGSYTLIEKYIKALEDKKFDLAEKIKFKMKGIRFNYRYKDVNESKHLVTIENNILKEFKEYLWKRK